KHMASIDLLIVLYKGAGPGIIALVSGEVSLQFTTPTAAFPHLRSGRLRALGVSTKTRVAALPDVPTIAEAALPGYEATQWFALFTTAGVPRPIVERLSEETARAVRSPDLSARMLSEGLEPVGNKPDEFAAFLRAELSKWAAVVKAAGIKPQNI
ncbi:MAG: tripartite tricarboxylate transporter substrate binding protein, partial [Betaproteobacteria bacterium]|nr:tripartite tricarboxylate transporter substrate binding protein [Betaproteobacteria bacterium]